MAEEYQHVTVLLEAAVEALSVNPDGLYIDGTFGRGGHARKILDRLGDNGRLIVIDKDPQAIVIARQLAAEDSRVYAFHGSFADYRQALENSGFGNKIAGMLLDLGVSSPQIDDAARGFSFQRNGDLDMRMNPEQGLSAADWLAVAEPAEIAAVLWKYGEERFARRIVDKIIERRGTKPLTTTLELANLISEAVPRKFHGRKHPATKSFQAIRIFINQELGDLERCIAEAVDDLVINGRLVVISFHSLEDRMIKRFFKLKSTPPAIPRGMPILESRVAPPFRTIGKALKPDEDEVAGNVRSRSSVMRILERWA